MNMVMILELNLPQKFEFVSLRFLHMNMWHWGEGWDGEDFI